MIMTQAGGSLQQVRHLVANKLSEEAIEMCQNLELQLSDSYADMLQFYSIFLATLLLSGNLNEAKYLWYRIGDAFKSQPNAGPTPPPATSSEELKLCLSSIWEVGIALWQDDYAAALRLLSDTSWPEYVQPILHDLHASVLKQFLTTIGSFYKNLTVALLSQLLQSPADSVTSGNYFSSFQVTKLIN